MRKQFLFDDHVEEYEEWYEQYPWVFRSEVEALREVLPQGDQLNGIEVGLGTGRFSQALGIKEGIEPSVKMRQLAIDRGVEIMDGTANHLPYGDYRFDFVLMNFVISYFDDLHAPFKEAHRVLKQDGVLVVGFVDRESIIGQYYEKIKPESTFYKHARFYSVDKVLSELGRAGFKHAVTRQTLFNELDEIKTIQPSRPGYGEGSFVVVGAMKKKPEDEKSIPLIGQ
ncbi:MAG TPA: class I SAM-dependent methyltransferase [Cyclobacteriaceae bacterium]|nr:class I SAM-dependent methyltransferase [Cyclobacteriaceae bacterium]